MSIDSDQITNEPPHPVSPADAKGPSSAVGPAGGSAAAGKVVVISFVVCAALSLWAAVAWKPSAEDFDHVPQETRRSVEQAYEVYERPPQ